MGFKKFISLWAIIIIATFLFMFYLPKLQTNQADQSKSSPQFNILWQGFSPVHGNQTPEYYVCINDYSANTLHLNIGLHVQNMNSLRLYFMIEQYQVPPAGWNLAPYYIGQIPAGTGLDFIYANLTREKPALIPEGELVEQVPLVVKAFSDEAYSKFSSRHNFTASYHLVDRTSASWTQLYHDNFDDGTGDGWTVYQSVWPSSMYNGQFHGGYWTQYYSPSVANSSPTPNYQHFESASCSLETSFHAQKQFSTNGSFAEAYLLYSFWTTVGRTLSISFNGVVKFSTDVPTSENTWYHFAVPLPLDSVNVQLDGGGYLDDVYVIARY